MAFDVTIGSTDGAIISEPVSIYILFKLVDQFSDIQGSLYKYDAPFYLKNISNYRLQRFENKLAKILPSYGF